MEQEWKMSSREIRSSITNFIALSHLSNNDSQLKGAAKESVKKFVDFCYFFPEEKSEIESLSAMIRNLLSYL